MVNEKVIFGIDISKGSPGAKDPPRYAVAVLSGSQVDYHRMVSRQKLIKMIWQLKPQILAVDNIHELTAGKKELISFMRRLPLGTKLVQVTGGEQLEPLTRLASSKGLSFDRFDPAQEAGACALLAGMDVGMEISVFEDRTFVKVSRARSLGRGGWSQNRYRRKVHGHVRQVARQIEDVLMTLEKERDIHYTSSMVKGFGGYVRGEFLVDATPAEIPVSPVKYGDVQVKVLEVERDAIQFKPLKEHKRKYVIVGIDPGTTTGIAILQLDGSLVKLHSGRGMSISNIVEIVAQYGRPLVVACDVAPIPGTVEKIRRSFNAFSGEPDVSLSAEDKISLARPYGYRNDHERDALASAANFYRRYKNRFDQIRKRVPPGTDADETIALVLKGENIEGAIAALTGRIAVSEHRPAIGEIPEAPDEKIIELSQAQRKQQETIDILKAYIMDLKSEISKQKHIISRQNEKIRLLKSGTYARLRKEKELSIKDEKINNLLITQKEKDRKIEDLISQVEELKRVRNLEISGKSVPVKVVATFTREAITAVKDQYGINPGDVLFFKDASGGGPYTVDMLAESGVKAVIFRGEMAHNAIEEFYEKNLPFFNVKSVPVHYVDDLGVTDPDELNALIESFKRSAESRKKMEKQKWLDNLVEEYKSERRRGIG